MKYDNILEFLRENIGAEMLKIAICEYLLSKISPALHELLDPSKTQPDVLFRLECLKGLDIKIPRQLKIEMIDNNARRLSQNFNNLDQSYSEQFAELEKFVSFLFHSIPLSDKKDFLNWIVNPEDNTLNRRWQIKIQKCFAILADKSFATIGLLDEDDLVRQISTMSIRYHEIEK